MSKKYPIWTKDYTMRQLQEFEKHVQSWKGRTTVQKWYNLAGVPEDSLCRYAKKYELQGMYIQAKQKIRRANRRWR